LPALDTLASFEAGSVTVDTAVDLATPESATSTPLPVSDPVAVFGASSATSVGAVGHATQESAASTPLPVPGPVAVFGAGSATPVAVGEARLCTEGSKDGKLNPILYRWRDALSVP
jgi:hypothetical protein